jgi:hypothetical protein
MFDEQINKAEDDKFKSLVAFIVEKILHDEAPEPAVILYRTMGPKLFAYWLHGFYCGYSQDKKLVSSELFQFLKEQCGGN